jgi:long-chain acyl-CoA synthetase
MRGKYLTDYLKANAKNLADKLALVCDDRSLTWQELYEEVLSSATALEKLVPGREQQVIALLIPNSWQYVVAYLAILEKGHIAAPMDVIYKPLELKAIIKQIDPILLIADKAGKKRIGKIGIPVVLAKELKGTQTKTISRTYSLPPNRQLASILFTSGTTGKPKATTSTHANHIWNVNVCSNVWGWTADDTILISLRLSHWYGLVMGLGACLVHGSTLYLHERFDARKTLETLASGKISLFTHGPVVYSKMLEVENTKNYDLSKVRLLISASGPLAPPVWEKFKQDFGQEILECYGSTETGRIASNLLDERIPGSPGRILPGVKMKLGPENEVLVKSPGQFPGYYKNDDATNACYTKDGWWDTGDIGEMKDGRIILKGRVQEKIRRNSYIVSPRDIEWAMLQHPKVKEIYVLGRQRPECTNDELVYFVAGDLDKDDIIAHSKIHLPSIWRPDQIVLLESVPRNSNGKPHLALLREMA